MEKKIKETTRLLAQGIIDIDEADKILLGLFSVSGSAFDCLKNIANPLNYLQEQAEKDGCKLNGQIAVSLCDDANYLRGLANNFLAQHYR